MERSLKHAWAEIIQAEDYEQHMSNVGQAQANAELVMDLLEASQLITGDRVLFAGAGPGQMFDFVSHEFLLPYEVTFTDINARFLDRLKRRVTQAGLTRFTVEIDDIEATRLKGPFAAAVVVLVLEHVDWRRALGQLVALKCRWLFLIIQRNPAEMETMVAPNRKLIGSLKEASEGEKPTLLEEIELTGHLESLGFRLERSQNRAVLDGKRCVAWCSRTRTRTESFEPLSGAGGEVCS